MTPMPSEFKLYLQQTGEAAVSCVPTDLGGLRRQGRAWRATRASNDRPEGFFLLRSLAWGQPDAPASSEQEAEVYLLIRPLGNAECLAPIKEVKYYTPARDPVNYHQQEVTNLLSLGDLVHDAVTCRDLQGIWRVMPAVAIALDLVQRLEEETRKQVRANNPPSPDPLKEPAPENRSLVCLQLPASVAIHRRTQKAYCLDAELVPERDLTPSGRSVDFAEFQRWFGKAEYRMGKAPAEAAPELHRRALARYLAYLLDEAGRTAPPDFKAHLTAAVQRLNDMAAALQIPPLNEWEAILKQPLPNPVPKVPKPPVVVNNPVPIPVTSLPDKDPPRSSVRGYWVLGIVCLVLLAALVVVLFLYYRKVSANVTNAEVPGRASAIALPGPTGATRVYLVVRPTPQTPYDAVRTALLKLFPEKPLLEVKGEASAANQLKEAREVAVKDLQQPQEVEKLLDRLDEKKVRFKGHTAGMEGLSGVLDNGGVYAFLETETNQVNGSLLRPDGLDQVLNLGEMKDDASARELLTRLRQAVADYAALKDALATVGKRRAFLLPVAPTAAALVEAAEKLDRFGEQLVFASRPALTLFDAVNPREAVVIPSGPSVLRLPLACYWREVNTQDRASADLAHVRESEKPQMRWRHFEPETNIPWHPVQLSYQGRTRQSSSFEVAVLYKDKVVVFRNQQLWTGARSEELTRELEDHVKTQLKLGSTAAESFSITGMAPNFTGTVLYAALAEQIAEEGIPAGSESLHLLSLEDFQKTMKSDDAAIRE